MNKANPAVLRKAAQCIRTGGLVKHLYEKGEAHCTLGALGPRDYYRVEDWRERAGEVTLLAEMIGHDCSDDYDYNDAIATIILWTDTPERTATDVITLLEQAAEKAEAG